MIYRRISAFDLDHTLLTGNCSFEFCRYLVERNVLSWFSIVYAGICYFRHWCFGFSLEKLHHHVFNVLLRGRSLVVLEQHVEAFVTFYIEKAMNSSVMLRLRLAQHLGSYTLILSNSPSFLVSAFASYLGVDEWQATRYRVDENRCLDSIDSIFLGLEKANHLKNLMTRFQIQKKDVTAYSDSILDLPFLLTAGEPIAVNPDRKLKAFATDHAWKILDANDA